MSEEHSVEVIDDTFEEPTLDEVVQMVAQADKVKATFDGTTGKLKTVELLA